MLATLSRRQVVLLLGYEPQNKNHREKFPELVQSLVSLHSLEEESGLKVRLQELLVQCCQHRLDDLLAKLRNVDGVAANDVCYCTRPIRF